MKINPNNSITYEVQNENCSFTQFSVYGTEKPPFFSIGKFTDDDLSFYLTSDKFSEKQKNLILSIFDLCNLSNNQVIDSTVLCESLMSANPNATSTIASSALLKRIAPLVAAKIFIKVKLIKSIKSKGKSPTLFVLRNDNVNMNEISLPKGGLLEQLDIFDAHQEVDITDNQAVRIDDFWCQMISAVLPIHDQSKKQLIKSTISFKDSQIPITVSSLADSRIPTIRSIKTIIAMLTIVEQIIKDRAKNDLPTTQQFSVELAQVLKVMRLNNEGSNRRNILKHLVEWNNTQFKFDELPSNIINAINEKFSVSSFGFSSHQLIHQLCGVGVLRKNQKLPSIVRFELPLDLVHRISEQGVYNLFTVTPSIMKENRPLAIALHLYCRKKLGHKGHLLTPSIKTLWKEIAGSMKFKDFLETFKSLMKERQITFTDNISKEAQIDQANILGYLITFNEKQVVINIDHEDKYIGSMSKHKFLISKKEREESSNVTKQHTKNGG